MSTPNQLDVPAASAAAAAPSQNSTSSAASCASSLSSAAPAARPTSSAAPFAKSISSIFSVVDATFSSSYKARKKLSFKRLRSRNRESKTYVAVSHDIYVLRRRTKDPAPAKLYDFRGSDRFDILHGSCAVNRRADGDDCKLCVTYPEHYHRSNRYDVLTILFVNEVQMNAFAELVEDVIASLDNLQAAVEAKRVRLKADGEDSKSQCEILKHLNIRPSASVTVDELDMSTRVTERLKNGMEALASGTELAAPLLAVLETLPVVGPFTKLVGVVGDVVRSEGVRWDMKEEMKKLHQECGEVARRVFSLLSSGLDMRHVEDDVVKDLLKILEDSLDTGREAEQFIMSVWLSQHTDVEKVKRYTGKMNQACRNIQLIHVKANSNRQLEGQSHMCEDQKELLEVQKGMCASSEETHDMTMERFDKIDSTLQARPELTNTFRRNDQVPDLPVFRSMKFGEGAGTPEAELKMKLLSNENSSRGLVGVIGMSGVGKSTMLNCVVHQKEVRDLYTGGIYSLDIGKGCDQRKVITEIARAVRASGGLDESDEITKKETVREAVNIGKAWFTGHRCLFVLDDVCTTKNSKTGFVHNVREVVDLQSGSRVLFSSRYEALGEVAVACDYVNVKEREADSAKGILCRHAQIDTADIDELQKGGRTSEKDKKSYDAFCGVLDLCNGFPLSLAVAGRTVARLAGRGLGDTSVGRTQYFQKLNTKGRLKRLWSRTVEEDGMEGYKGFLETVRWTWHAFGKMNKPVEGRDISEIRHMHCGLCIFGQQERVPIHVVQKLWDVEAEEEAEEIAMWLCGAGLVEIHKPKDAGGTLSISVHDLIQKVCVTIGEEFGMSEEDWHRRLLAKYVTNGDWAWEWWRCKDIDDGYMRENLRRHLIAGGLWEDLGELLVDFRWIQSRLRKAEDAEQGPSTIQEEILSLLRDYEALKNNMCDIASKGSTEREEGEKRDVGAWDGVGLIGEAVRLSAKAFRIDPSYGQVATQLQGRLFTTRSDAVVNKFLESLAKYQEGPWIRTIQPWLFTAGGAERKEFQVTTVEESGECSAVQVKYIPNSRELLLTSGEGKRMAVIIDLESERITKRLVCTRDQNESDDGETLTCSAVSRDGRYVVAGHGGSIHVWDLTKSGDENCSDLLCINDVDVTAVDISPDAKHVIVGFSDGALGVWGIRNRKVVSDEKACPGRPVQCVAVSPSGCLIACLSCSRDWRHTAVHVWKLSETGVITQQAKAMLDEGELIYRAFSLDDSLLSSAPPAVPSDGEERLQSTATEDGEEEGISSEGLFEALFSMLRRLHEASDPQVLWSADDRIFVATADKNLLQLKCSGGDINVDCQQVSCGECTSRTPGGLTNMTVCGDEGQYVMIENGNIIHVHPHTHTQDSPITNEIIFSMEGYSHLSFDVSPCKTFVSGANRCVLEGNIRIVEWSFDRLMRGRRGDRNTISLTPSFDGRFVAVRLCGKRTCFLAIWDAESANLLWEVEVNSDEGIPPDELTTVQIAFSTGSSLVGISNACEKGQVTFHDVRSGDLVHGPLKTPLDWHVCKIALSRNGRLLAVGHWESEDEGTNHAGRAKFLSVWDIESGQCVMRPKAVVREQRRWPTAHMTVDHTAVLEYLGQSVLFLGGGIYCEEVDVGFEVEDILFSEDGTMINVSHHHAEKEPETCEGDQHRHIYEVWCVACGELQSEAETTFCRSSSHPRTGDLYVDGDYNIREYESEYSKKGLEQPVVMSQKKWWFDRKRKRLWIIAPIVGGQLGIVELVGDAVVDDSQRQSSCTSSLVESPPVPDITSCACVSRVGNEAGDESGELEHNL